MGIADVGRHVAGVSSSQKSRKTSQTAMSTPLLLQRILCKRRYALQLQLRSQLVVNVVS